MLVHNARATKHLNQAAKACYVYTMKTPNRLYHRTPPWVSDEAVFHIRIRSEDPDSLIEPARSMALQDSVRFYFEHHKWSCYLFLIMPDHIHGLFSFTRSISMSRVLSDWKRYHQNQCGIIWQDNYFDHRIRNGAEYSEKYAYIERNPVVKKLCTRSEEWSHRCSAFDETSVPFKQ